jgi:hypothetical protein
MQGCHTFIGGENGSGKSTVLLALTLALGGPLPSGSNPVRDASVEKRALAEVTLHNDGPDGATYLPQRYGKRIHLIRTITVGEGDKLSSTQEVRGDPPPGGGKPFVAKGAAAKAELAALCAQFNISVANPVMVTDQETAKNVLNQNPALLYDYFLKATHLNTYFDAVCDFKKRMDETKESLEMHTKKVAALDDVAVEREREYKEVAALSTFAARIQAAERDVLWAEFREREAGGDGLRANLESAARASKDAKERLEKVRGGIEKFNQHRAAAAARADAANTDADRKLEEVNAAKEKLEAASKPLAQAQREVEKAEARAAKAEKEVAAAKKKRGEAEEKKAAAMASSRIAAADAALAGARGRCEAASRAVAAAASAEGEKREEAEKLEGDLREAEGAERKAREGAKCAMERVRALSAAGAGAGDPLAAYRALSGVWDEAKAAVAVADLVRANPGRFTTPPLGPLGSLVRLRDPSWAHAAEVYFKSSVNDILCSCPRDMRALEDLVAEKAPALRRQLRFCEVGLKADVRVPKCLAQAGAPRSLRSILEVDKALVPPAAEGQVENALDKKLNAHSTLLCATSLEAKKALLALGDAHLHGLSVERRVNGKIFFKHTTVGANGSAYEVSLNPKSDSAQGLLRGADPAAEREDAAAASARAGASLKEAEAELKAARLRATAAVQAASQAAANVKAAEAALANAEVGVKAAEKALKRANAEAESDAAAEQELADAEDALREKEEVLAQEQEAVATARAKKEALKPAIDALKATVNDAAARVDTAEQEAAVEDLKKKRENVKKVRAAEKEMRKSADEAEATAQNLQDEFDDFKDKLKLLLGDAQKATGMEGPRQPGEKGAEPVPASLAAARGKVKSLQAAKEKEKKRLHGKDEKLVEAAYKAAIQASAQERAAHDLVKANVELLDAEKKKNLRKFKEFRAAAEADVKRTFLVRMAQKGHSGSLEFVHYGDKDTEHEHKDYGKGELRMRVIADAAAAGKDGFAAKEVGGSAASLSGGEKSITSLILLSAIANVSQPPFRVVDEFDVVRVARNTRANPPAQPHNPPPPTHTHTSPEVPTPLSTLAALERSQSCEKNRNPTAKRT